MKKTDKWCWYLSGLDHPHPRSKETGGGSSYESQREQLRRGTEQCPSEEKCSRSEAQQEESQGTRYPNFSLLPPPTCATAFHSPNPTEGRAPGMLVDKVHKDYRTKAQCGTESASGGKERKMSSTPPFHSSLHNRSLPRKRTFYLLGKRKQRKKVNTSSTFLRVLAHIRSKWIKTYFIFCFCTHLGLCTAHHTVVLM